MDEMAPGTPGNTDWPGRNRDLARYMYRYIMGTRPRGRGVHRQIWKSACDRDPVGTGYVGEIIGEARPLAVRVIHLGRAVTNVVRTCGLTHLSCI